MTKKEQTTIWVKAIQTYGVDSQMDMLVEECAELIAAINHYKRNREHYLSELYGELADVEIMLNQMRLVFNPDEINSLIDYKTRRLEKRLKSGE